MADVLTPHRRQRWRAAGSYEDGLRRLDALVHILDPASSRPSGLPAWTTRDLLAHLAGVAADASAGGYLAGALDAWRDDGVAADRERWRADHVSLALRRPRRRPA